MEQTRCGLKPYNARFRKTIAPNIAPEYWPDVDQIFSANGAVQKACPMSPYISPSKFFTAIININLASVYLMIDK